MSGAVVAGAVVSTAVGVGAKAIMGGGKGGGSISGGGGGSGGGLSILDQQYADYGPHQSTTPLKGSGEQLPKEVNPYMPLDTKAGKASVSTGHEADNRTSPAAQPDNVPGKFQDIWASRLSKYLDYNTRGLG